MDLSQEMLNASGSRNWDRLRELVLSLFQSVEYRKPTLRGFVQIIRVSDTRTRISALHIIKLYGRVFGAYEASESSELEETLISAYRNDFPIEKLSELKNYDRDRSRDIPAGAGLELLWLNGLVFAFLDLKLARGYAAIEEVLVMFEDAPLGRMIRKELREERVRGHP